LVSLVRGRIRIARQEDIVTTTFATLLVAFAAASGPGPIAASIARHATDVRVESTASNDPSWSTLKRLAPGTDVVVTVNAPEALNRVFVSANDDAITVINRATDPPCRAATSLVDLAKKRPDLFEPSHVAIGFVFGDVDVRADRIVFSGTWDCATDTIIEQISRANIRAVKSAPTVQSSAGWTVAGVALGFIAGGYVSVGAALGGCGASGHTSPGCGVAMTAGLWGPVAGGLLGHYTTKQVIETTYYLRPAD
jgi:hypothetical protein